MVRYPETDLRECTETFHNCPFDRPKHLSEVIATYGLCAETRTPFCHLVTILTSNPGVITT